MYMMSEATRLNSETRLLGSILNGKLHLGLICPRTSYTNDYTVAATVYTAATVGFMAL
jgi:hypothetical protein